MNKYQSKNLRHQQIRKKKIIFTGYILQISNMYIIQNCEEFKSQGQMKNFPMRLSSAAECRGEGFALPREKRSVHIGEGE